LVSGIFYHKFITRQKTVLSQRAVCVNLRLFEEITLAGAWVEQQVGHRMLQSGEEVAGEYQFNPMKVLPKDREHFYAYGGSLTTPPCTEGVQWIVFKETIELSREQLDRFMRAYGPIARPVQPLHDREIQAQ
jgi:hypothetical protein